MLFAMNFECKSTFNSKWKRFWITSLKICAKIEVTKHPAKTRFARKRVYTVVGHLFFKLDEMRLR